MSRHFLVLMAENVQKTVSEAAEIGIAAGAAFKDLDLVVAAYGEAVGVKNRERIKASPRNSQSAHLLAPFPSYFTKILGSRSLQPADFCIV